MIGHATSQKARRRARRAVGAVLTTVALSMGAVAGAHPVQAERLPRSPGPSALRDAITVSVTGRPQLAVPVTLNVSVTLHQSRPGTITVNILSAGRRCLERRALPSGTQRTTISCATVATTAHLAGLPVSLAVDVPASPGRPARRTTTALRLPVGDAPAVSAAVAQRRWTALADRLAAVAPQSVAPESVAPQSGQRDLSSQTLFNAADAAQRVRSAVQAGGWNSTLTRQRLSELMALRNPDGGFGLSQPWDAYQDGTINRADTSYTVTTAGHVGDLLLEAYRAGAVPESVIAGLIDHLLDRVPRSAGACFAYSTSPNDRAKPCVYNVSFGAGAFLQQASEVSAHRQAEVGALLATMRAGLTRGYDRQTGYWRYSTASRTAQDMSHQLYTAASVDLIDPNFGALDRMMARPWWQHPHGLTQPGHVIASSMISVAGKRCQLARSPGLLLGAERTDLAGAPSFAVSGMSRVAREVADRCFGVAAQSAGRGLGVPIPPVG